MNLREKLLSKGPMFLYLVSWLALAFFLVSVTIVSAQTPDAVQNFNRAKNLAHKVVFTNEHRVDLYCGCLYNNDKEIIWESCGYSPRHNVERGKRLEWEHVVPAMFYVKKLACRNRDECQDNVTLFNKFEGDLHNLRPSVGELNADRSSKLYGIVAKKEKKYGQCNFYTTKKTAEPPDDVKGDVARITLYINEKYSIDLPSDYLDLMHAWSMKDPVSAKEKEINKKIYFIQGDSNPYVGF
jgi:deoxyribonuclease-1